ncbi:serine/threonine-protein kinase [Aliikangiella coralliicola]|uniref:Protein kinase n=1 Tax=Aliikangiella coralliicola TaxID=2592383 RepID=A0A545UJR8_9GAMM|nr:serine/threonine-protein kinase [Aliikangiella coralliicola]TQV89683.1 protein kinase [Aliikangiella coralliicola]
MNCKKCQQSNSPLNFFCDSCGEELIAEGQMMTLSTSSSNTSPSNTFSSQYDDGDDIDQTQTRFTPDLTTKPRLNLSDEKLNSDGSITLPNPQSFVLTATHKREDKDDGSNTQSGMESGHPFQIVKKVGEGAMGIVYKARDTQLNRLIALKIFRNKRVTRQIRENMLDEARLASALNHPNVVTIYDVARNKDNCFIAMEWIEGKTLDRFLAPLVSSQGEGNQFTKLSSQQKLSYARQIAAGLASAHKAGIIHRDLKPTNIMIRASEPRVKILDFGIAEISSFSQQTNATKQNLENASLNSDSTLDRTNQTSTSETISPAAELRGTLCYMSPEQSRGRKLTTSSDVFAFGIILYQMFYGNHPFYKKQPELTLEAIRTHTPEFRPNSNDGESKKEKSLHKIPKVIERLIQQCLNKDPVQRPKSMAEIELTLLEAEREEKNRRSRGGWRYWFTSWRLIPLASLAAVAVITTPQILREPTPISRENILLNGKTIAILPFDNISGDPALDVFSRGLSISLSNELALVGQENKDTWVIPSTELRKLKDTSAEAIYKKYNPELILSGSIQHLGNIRRLNISILNAKDSKLLHSIVHDIPVNEVFKWQSKIRDSILNLLDWSVSNTLQARLNQPLTNGSEAYQSYLEGLAYLYRYDYKDNLDKAISAFEKAVEIDTGFLEATRELAGAYIRAAKIRNGAEWLEQAEIYGKRAINLAPQHSLSHSILGNVLYAKTEFDKAMQSYQKAIKMDSNNAIAYFGLAKIYKRNGELDKAEQTYLRSLEINENWIVWNYLAVFYYRTNQLDKAESAYSMLQKLTPNNDVAYQINGAIQMSRGDYKNALKTFTEAIKIEATGNNYSNLGTVQFYQKNYDDSIKNFLLAVNLNPKNHKFWHNLGDSYRWKKDAKSANSAYYKALNLLKLKMSKQPNKRLYKITKAMLLAKMGKVKEALREMELIDNINDSYHKVLAAQIFTLCGQYETSIDWINKALLQGYPKQSLIDEPEFQKLFESSWRKKITFLNNKK